MNSAPDVTSGMEKTIGLSDNHFSIIFLPVIHSVMFSLLPQWHSVDSLLPRYAFALPSDCLLWPVFWCLPSPDVEE